MKKNKKDECFIKNTLLFKIIIGINPESKISLSEETKNIFYCVNDSDEMKIPFEVFAGKCKRWSISNKKSVAIINSHISINKCSAEIKVYSDCNTLKEEFFDKDESVAIYRATEWFYDKVLNNE